MCEGLGVCVGGCGCVCTCMLAVMNFLYVVSVLERQGEILTSFLPFLVFFLASPLPWFLREVKLVGRVGVLPGQLSKLARTSALAQCRDLVSHPDYNDSFLLHPNQTIYAFAPQFPH